jgi:hypothetical protein
MDAKTGSLGGSLLKVAIPRGEARVTNQRAEDRKPGLVQHTLLWFRRRKHVVPVINVSSRGAMVHADIDARIGETVELQFAEASRTKCLVRWMREGRIGLEFVKETIVWDCFEVQEPDPEGSFPERPKAQPKSKKDRAPRHALVRMGSLLWNGMTLPVRIRNISSGGAKLESGRELAPGSEVELNLGEAGWVYAEVRWCREGQVGLRFADEFSLESLAARAREPSAPANVMLKPQYLESENSPDSPWAARFERLSLTELKPPAR